MKKPEICPICGSKVKRVVHATTGNSYYRCSNKDCIFVLGTNYTEAEMHLQGTKLSSECLKCGDKLTVVNGPNGLYAKCPNCDCDSKPIKYQGRLYMKYANAYRENVREEVKLLIRNYQSKKVEKEFDFEEFIAVPSGNSTSLKKRTSTVEIKGGGTTQAILSVLATDVEMPMNSKYISEKIGKTQSQVRPSLYLMRKSGKIKIVGYDNSCLNPSILYQVADSPLPEMRVFSEKEGYISISKFIESNAYKYGGRNNARAKLMAGIKKANLQPVPYSAEKGICDGYLP